ncbi:MAG TPA: carboxypeptidase-like regulatory domain-containing protein, partial [Bryobacteraceae bacterium]|nr:carboxypeptidase-like regulatory domain-containing protein [Bryobacteraceae bacterium]
MTDAAGIPQMGATVLLYNRLDHLYERGLTNERGQFTFAGLIPDIYSIRITLASFGPAVKSRIVVQPGEHSILNVSLATLFSSIQVVYPGKTEKPTIMTDDWKWVLRTASSTRPVLRLLPRLDTDPSQPDNRTAVFSDTRGMLKVAAGDGGLLPGGGGADVGTAFALATSLFGKNSLQFSGNLGSGSHSGVPSAAFRTSFSRGGGQDSPQVAVTMRQLFLPGRVVEGLATGNGLPAMRSLSVSVDERKRISDSITLEYGFAMDSVSFLDRLNYFSPYARLTYDTGGYGQFEFVYTSGNARPDLAVVNSDVEADSRVGTELQRDLSSLAMFPQVSLRNGRAKVQRGDDVEIGYSRKIGSRTYHVGVYHESVRNTALTIAAPAGLYVGTDLLPDLVSGNSTFNAGDYQTQGYTASVTQDIGEHFSGTIMYGSIGGLAVDERELASENPDDLRSMIRAGRRHAATVRITATAPWTGTHLIAGYQWSDQRMVTTGQLYSTQTLRPEPGLNLYVRQ